MKKYLKEHRFALIAAMLVGFLCVAPSIYFRLSLGSHFRGLDYFPLDNEEFYIARMHEVLDGHPLVGSMPYADHKDALPIMPPTIEWMYAGVAMLFHVSLPIVVIAGKFVLPALLFFLVYRFIRRLTDDEKNTANVFNAIAGGLLVTLGSDLTDIPRIVRLLKGASDVGGMPLWTRPVNPIAGAILLFIFLNCLWMVANDRKRRWIIPAGLALSLMFASYFFSWGLALCVLFSIGVLYGVRKQFARVIDFGWIFLTGLVGALPYWVLVFTVRSNPLFAELSTRFGMIRSHDPLWNKVLIAALVIFGGVSIFYWKKQRLGERSWWLFSVALLGGGLIALNQQVITGTTIWPFHFVQYTIPFSFVALVVLAYHTVRVRFPRVWTAAIYALIAICVAFAAYTEVLAYRDSTPRFAARQQWADIFDWLNANTPKDSVVFINDNFDSLDLYIPAYTHNNLYFTQSIVMAPRERFIRGYMSFLRMKGVTADRIDAYLKENRGEASGYLYTSLIRFFRIPGSFEEVRDDVLDATLARLPDDYRQFLHEDFLTSLKKYQLDYILSKNALPEDLLKSLGNPSVVRLPNGTFIYRIL